MHRQNSWIRYYFHFQKNNNAPPTLHRCTNNIAIGRGPRSSSSQLGCNYSRSVATTSITKSNNSPNNTLFNILQKWNKLPQLKHLQSPASSQKKNSSLVQQQLKRIQKDATLSLQSRIPICLLSVFLFVSANAVIGTITHFNDEYFPYYPMPFALDVSSGPSMIPSMYADGRDLYLRDCWSHRFVWLDWDNIKICLGRLLRTNKDEANLESSTTNLSESEGDGGKESKEGNKQNKKESSLASYNKPWQKGDIVVFLQPDSKYLATKRIIGVEGDTIQVYGEHALDFYNANKDGDLGVNVDARYPVPFCRKVNSVQSQQIPKHKTTFIIPAGHGKCFSNGSIIHYSEFWVVNLIYFSVWVEGDNPLYSTDSRHFGPLPMTALRGRLLLRLWPIRRQHGEGSNHSGGCIVSSKRPAPFLNPKDWLEGGKYGVREMTGDEIERLHREQAEKTANQDLRKSI